MKKIIAIALALTICFAFAACTSTEPTTPTDTDAEKTLIMGTSAGFPPYEYVADDGSYAGIDVEIATAIAEKLGAKLEIKDMEFNSLISAVDGGAIDFALAGMTVTDERKESVNFSETYATGVQVVIVKEGSDIKSSADLEGKRVAVQLGTSGEAMLADDLADLAAGFSELVTCNSTGEVPDAIGWTCRNSILFECKTSRADFLRERNKLFRYELPDRGMGDWRFYIALPGVIRSENELPEGWGVYLYIDYHKRPLSFLFGRKYNWTETAPLCGNKDHEIIMLRSHIRRIRNGHD